MQYNLYLSYALVSRGAQEYDLRGNPQLNQTSVNKAKQHRTKIPKHSSDTMFVIYSNNMTL